VSASVYFVPEGHITRPLTVISDQVPTPGNVFLLIGRGYDNGHCEALLSAEESEILGIESESRVRLGAKSLEYHDKVILFSN
jgi:hypothetical protein